MRPAPALFPLAIWTLGTLALGAIARAEPAPSPPLPEGAPSFEEVVSLRRAGSPVISPDGRHVAFEVRTADWADNRFDAEIWLARDGGEPFQLTRTAGKGSGGPRFSPDGRWLGFLADRGDGRQLFLIRVDGGEAFALTSVEEGIGAFRFSPDGKRVAFTRDEPETKAQKAREELYGRFAVEDAESKPAHLWLLDIVVDPQPGPSELPCREAEEDCPKLPEARRLTESDDFTVEGFEWSPDGQKIVFERRASPRITDYVTADISVLDVASGELRDLVAAPGFDGDPSWSPDGAWILYGTAGGDTTSDFYRNGQLFKIPAVGGEAQRLAAGFDENLSDVVWTEAGIYFLAWQKTRRQVFRIDPASGEVALVASTPDVVRDLAASRDGLTLALRAGDAETLPEIYRVEVAAWEPKALTSMTHQVEGWTTGSSEVISWTSRDGATIEGVLHKPAGFDPSRRYPLLVVIHGGPTGIDVPARVPGYVYPIVQWLEKGALVLRPNYRGSAGYGEAFRSLNVGNLGEGDAWDVLSGVDALIAKGWVEPERIGAMGWSQGGYISAFLTTTSDRFQAISVGAGISDWTTYYVNTDIHPFTRQYLRATPWDDPEVYARTSPMTFIRQAQTPTLIQHGENDRRVPIPNAYKLFQGLRDQGVETELVVYEDFGHGINRPKEMLAAIWHNWRWFARHLWGEDIEIPLEAEAD